MAGVLESLIVKLSMNAKDYDDGLNKASQGTEAFTSKTNSLFDGMVQGVGMQLASLATSAAASLGGMALDSIGMASDFNESLSKVGVVFGENAGAIEAWSKTASTSLGQSQQGALEAAGTFGNLFSAMGIGKAETLNMSEGVIALASDLASFNNIKPEEALDKLRAGLVGEAEPLRALGVNINAATIEAKALSMGMTQTDGAFTAAQKAQASYALILEQTTAAQGDFARTSDGMANQQRIMDAQFQDIQTTVGQLFIPVVQSALTLVTGWLPVLQSLVTGFTQWAAGITSFSDLFQIFEDGSGYLTDLLVVFGMNEDAAQAFMQKVYDVTQAILGQLEPVIALGVRLKEWAATITSFSDLWTIYEDGSGYLTDLLVVFGLSDDAAQAFMISVYDIKKAITEMLTPIISAIESFVSWQDLLTAAGILIAAVVVPAIFSMAAAIGAMVIAALPFIGIAVALIAAVALLRHAWESDFGGMQTKIKAFIDWIVTNWGPFLDGVQKAWQAFSSFMTDAWQGLTDGLKAIWGFFTGWWNDEDNTTLQNEKGKWEAWGNFFTSLWGGLTSGLKSGWSAFLSGWNGETTSAIATQQSSWQSAMSSIGSTVQSGLSAMQGYWSAHSGDVQNLVGDQWAIISGLFSTTLGLITGLLTAAFQMMSGDWSGGFQTLYNTANNALSQIDGIFTNMLNTIADLFAFFGWRDLGNQIVQGIADGISAGASWIEDAARNAAQSALDAAKSLLGISSPSKVARDELGIPFTQGMGIGAEAAIPGATKRLQTAIDGMVADLQAPSVNATAPGAGRPAINITIYADSQTSAATAKLGILDGLRAAGLA